MSEWPSIVRDRLTLLNRDVAGDDARVDELAQHLEDRFNDERARGATIEAARAAAMAELDGHERFTAEIARRRARDRPARPMADATPSHWHTGLRHDVRDALRALRRSPGFAIAAVATVALTTGPTTAALGIANWLLLRSIPEVTGPHRMATVHFGVPAENGYTVSRVSYQHIADLVTASPSVDAMAGWQSGSVSVATGGGDQARVVPAEFVSGNFFDVLGVRLVAGRAFHAGEDRRPGGESVTVLSFRLARSLYPAGADPVGQSIRINGHLFTVIGVAPRAFPGTRIQGPVDLWLPGMTSMRVNHWPADRWAYPPDRGPFYQYLARLAPGATFDQAAGELRAAALALSQTSAEARKFATVQPMLHAIIGVDPLVAPRIRSFVRALIGTGVLLVLLGAANLANLFVFRALRRNHETAVRRALGASALRLVRLQLAETLIVAIMGGLTGVAMVLGAQAVLGTVTASAVGSLEVPLDWRLLAMAFGVSVAVGLLMGFAPARLAMRASVSHVLGQGGRSSSRVGARMRTGFAVTQLALSLTLFVGALLLVATLRNIRGTDAGFDARGVTYATFEFRLQAYSADRTAQFLRDLAERLRREHPQDVIALADAAPMAGGGVGQPVGVPGAARESLARANTVHVSPTFFAALGIDIVAGRTFTEEESRQVGTEPGVLVSETLARQLYGTTAVVGRPVMFGATASAPQHDVPIIGVTGDVRWSNLEVAAPPMLFGPGAAIRGPNTYLVVRSSETSDRVDRRVRAAAMTMDPALPVMPGTTLESRIAVRLGERRLFAIVSTALALLGFALAAVGIHGLISQTVVERTREFGIRLAIGATRTQIVGLVLRSALVVIAAGMPLGLLLAFFSSRLIENRLYGVTPGDLAPYAAGVGALLAIAIAASVAPARRASRANPVEVLRAE